MLDLPIANNQVVTVMVAQTTFAVLAMPRHHYRVGYFEKAEARLKPGMRGEFSSCLEHPLLLSYNSPLVGVYVNSRLPAPENLLTEIQQRIEAAFQGWRDWRCVLYGGADQLRKNMVDGSGMLLSGAPVSIAKAVIEACKDYGVLTYFDGDLEALPVRPPHHLLLIGEGYVIAQDFHFTEVLTKTTPQASPAL